MDWNTFQYIDVIAQTGSLSKAARILAINQSTLSRHLQKFEQTSGVRVFKRSGNKYVTTEVGRHYVSRARDMRQAIEGVSPTTTALTVTSLDSFFSYVLLKHVHAFPHPVHFVSGNSNLDLARREADVAIRFGKPHKGDYMIKKLGRIGCAVYSHKKYTRRGSLATRAWASLNESFSHTDDGRWLAVQPFKAQVTYTVTSYPQIQTLVEHSDCIGLLPCFMGDASPHLTRFSGGPVFYREVWMVIHRNLQDAAVLKEFKTFLVGVMKKNAQSLEG